MDASHPSAGLSHQDLMDYLDNLQTAIQHRATASGGLAIGSASAAKVKIVNTTTYLHNGHFKSKSTAEVAFTATTHDIPASASTVQEAVYLLTLAADGTPTLTMGAIATGSGNAKLPDVPSAGTPIGYVRIAVAAGSTSFDASTDNLSAGHITDTYYDVGFLAPRFDGAQ